jgi:hypothetical protein
LASVLTSREVFSLKIEQTTKKKKAGQTTKLTLPRIQEINLISDHCILQGGTIIFLLILILKATNNMAAK